MPGDEAGETMTDQTQQQELPFAQAEGSYAEREALVLAALARAECDLYLARFVMQVFYYTAGGTGEPLKKSYAELAARPRWLCCSASKARSTVRRAIDLGLIEVDAANYSRGARDANRYSIDWAGVRAGRLTHAHHPVGFGLIRQGHVLLEQGLGSTEQGPVSGEHHTKEQRLFFGNSPETLQRKPPAPDPEAGPPPEFLITDPDAWPASDPPGVDLSHFPELVEARARPVALLAPRSLRLGVFHALAAEHLGRPVTMVEWFRRQAAAPQPVCPPNEAYLLLVLASSAESLRLRERGGVANPVGWFVVTVKRQAWLRCLPSLPSAIESLAALVSRYGRAALLESPADRWPPQPLSLSEQTPCVR